MEIKGPQREEKGDKKKPDAEAILIKGPQMDEMGDNKERMQRLYRSRTRSAI